MRISPEQIQPHLNNFQDKLQIFPRLEPTLSFFQNPENWPKIVHAFHQYRLVLKKLVELNKKEIKIIADINKILKVRGADAFLQELSSDQRARLIATLNEALNPESPIHQAALEELQSMMLNGQQIFDAGEKPQDDDTKSDAAIWGFTQIPPENVETQLHFIVCHFIERFMTQVYRQANIEIAHHKDYLLEAMTDVILLELMKNNRFSKIFYLWHYPKEQGGLDWITIHKLMFYLIAKQYQFIHKFM